MNRFKRTAIVGMVAMALAVGLARIDFSASAVDSADRVVVAASEFSPDEVRAENLLAVAPADTAIDFFEDRVAANPSSYIDLTHLANQHLRRARDLGISSSIVSAEHAALRALEINHNYAPAQLTYAKVLATGHRFADAIEWAEKVPQSSPTGVGALALIGDSHLAVGNYKKADEYYARLASVSAGNASISRLAHLTFLMGDTNRAIELAQTAASRAHALGVTAHDMAWQLAAIGEFYLADGNPEYAIDYFQGALELAPDHIFAMAGSAHSQWMLGDLAASTGTYEHALQQVPDDTGLIAELAAVYRADGRTDDAETLVDLAIASLSETSASPEVARRELAQIFVDNDLNLDEAVRLSMEEVAARPDVYAYDLHAWALFKVGKYREARSAIEKALSLGTRDASFYYHAGVIYAELGMNADAFEALTTAQEINPNFSLRDSRHAIQLLESVS